MSVERIAAHLRGETVSPSEAAGVHESAPDHGGRISRPFDPYQGWGPGPWTPDRDTPEVAFARAMFPVMHKYASDSDKRRVANGDMLPY